MKFSWNSPGEDTGVGSLFPSLNLPNPGIEPRSPSLQADSSPAKPPGKPKNTGVGSLSLLQQIFLTQESNRGLLHCRRILYQLSYQRIAAITSYQKLKWLKATQICLTAMKVIVWNGSHWAKNQGVGRTLYLPKTLGGQASSSFPSSSSRLPVRFPLSSESAVGHFQVSLLPQPHHHIFSHSASPASLLAGSCDYIVIISLSHDPYLNHTCKIFSVLWGNIFTRPRHSLPW